MEADPSKKKEEELYILVIMDGEKLINKFKNYLPPITSKPNVHVTIINTYTYEKDVEALKDIKFNVFCCLPFNMKCVVDILNMFPTIKWIHNLTVGLEGFFSNKEFVEKLDNNLTLTNGRGAYSEPLVEMVMTGMLYFSFKVFDYVEGMQNRDWNRPKNKKMIYEKNLLIYGYGCNGACLAKKAKESFNMKVNGVVRTIRDDIKGKEFVENIYTIKTVPDNVINEADYIFSTMPSSDETRNIFDKNFFNKMNKDAVFLNIGRGDAVVEDDIADALNNDKIRGAFLDVTAQEPLDKNSKLYDISPRKLLISNHSMGVVDDYFQLGIKFFVDNVLYYLENGKQLNIVPKDKGY